MWFENERFDLPNVVLSLFIHADFCQFLARPALI